MLVIANILWFHIEVKTPRREMVEVSVLFVIEKIGIAVTREALKLAKPLLGKTSELQMALPVNMKLIKDELEVINAFLKEIGMKGCNSEVMETWIKQVRRLAYDMEDIVDEYIYLIYEYQQRETWASVKKFFMKRNSLFSLDDIAIKADIINKEVKELSKRIGRWAQPMSSENYIPAINYDSEQQLYHPGHDHSISDNELVGIDKNREILINSLHMEESPLQIIAVWGMGGLGKSTLVNNVYNDAALIPNFNCHAWVSVSQSSKIIDIWRNMLKEISGNDNRALDPASMNSAELKVELMKILDKRRYLIILDDVWTTEVLLKIREVLVDNGLGSRVIITTRNEEVASLAKDDCKIKVEPLNDHDAWLLFCRKAFSKTKNHFCPTELQQCGKDIVDKCDGLPLVLVAIGSLLSLKKRSVKDWRVFYNQLIWELHNNEGLNHVEKILNLSYKYLPNYLKNCFLYFAIFPEDYPILRKRLIRLWIAEGFIEQKGACSLEEIAESYLGELVQRSLLQVAKCNSFDRIQYLRMHDLVRELAIFQSIKENFSINFDDTHGMAQVGLDFRRVSVHQCNKGIQSSICPSRHRTFISFDTSMKLSSWYSFIFSGSKYLTVLDLSGLPLKDIPNSIGDLFNLRYLCLDDSNVKELPRSITKLHNLQTLSLERTQVLNFPQGFFKLKKLRHLLVWKLLDATYRSFHNWEPMEPFEGLWDMKELQSLNEVRATKMFVAKLLDLSQLRSVSITYVRSNHCAQLCYSLSKMHQLTKLHIRAINQTELLLLEDLTLQNPLEKLELIGRLSEGTLDSPFFYTHRNQLLQIELSWCQLIESPVTLLSGLTNLTELRLTRAYTGQQLNFHGTWFQKLKSIVLADLPELNQICIQEGSLVRLECLHMDRLKELQDVPTGIEFLNSVKEAYFTRMRSDFVRNLQMAKLNHIPKVYWSTQGESTGEAEPDNLPGPSSTSPQWRLLGVSVSQ